MADDTTIEASIVFARLDNGHVVAASTASPYFCVEAADEETAKKEVEAALVFYVEAKRKIRANQPPIVERQITVRRIRSYSRRKQELAAA